MSATFLVPIRESHYWLHRFSRTAGGHRPSSALSPKETLDLLSRIISDDPRCTAYDHAQVLDLIVESYPTLAAHTGMKRLQNLALMRWRNGTKISDWWQGESLGKPHLTLTAGPISSSR